MFGYNFSEHMRGLGYFPESCFYDDTTIVFDPSDPMTDEPSTVIDVMGNMVTGTVTLNPGNLCLGSPFWEIAVPNGLDDIVEHFAWGGVRSTVNRSPEHVNATPHVIEFYDEIVERLTNDYNHVNEWYSTYVYKEPVPYGEPIHRLKEILKELVKTRGITSILLFSNYHRSTDFEMSGNAWPNFQEAVDEINTELGTSIGLGSIANNDYRLIDYESFLRSQFLTLWELVKSSNVPPGKKVALMGAGHGSGSTSRLYDVSRLQSPIQEQVIEDYINERLSSIYPTDTPFRIDYSEYSNSLTDGARGVGEQVWQWVNEGYDYIFIYPMEWPWGSGETWRGLRGSAVELVDPENTEIFVSDSRIRGETLVNGVTRIIVGETIFEQVPYNPVPYHYYRASNVQLLEDKMIALTGAPEPQLVSGTLSIRGEDVNLSLDFSDSLLINESNMTLQNAAVRGMVTRLNKLINGVLDNEDMAMYVFALLAENAIDVESVEVEWGKMRLREGREGSLRGSVTALATAKIGGRDTRLFAVIRIR
jgi:hypothetical protein